MSGETHSDPVETIARDILNYLEQHPQAEDSLEGIAHWWLLEHYLIQHIPLVEAALDYLIDKGFLIKLQTPGSPVRYRFDPSMMKPNANHGLHS